MNFDEYQRETGRTEKKDPQRELVLKNAIGVASEAGEILDNVKRWAFHGKELDVPNLREEIGDALWYLSQLAAAVGIPLDQAARENIEKLYRRFPGEYSHEACAARADKLVEVSRLHRPEAKPEGGE